jgi:hypothetical protein
MTWVLLLPFCSACNRSQTNESDVSSQLSKNFKRRKESNKSLKGAMKQDTEQVRAPPSSAQLHSLTLMTRLLPSGILFSRALSCAVKIEFCLFFHRLPRQSLLRRRSSRNLLRNVSSRSQILVTRHLPGLELLTSLTGSTTYREVRPIANLAPCPTSTSSFAANHSRPSFVFSRPSAFN